MAELIIKDPSLNLSVSHKLVETFEDVREYFTGVRFDRPNKLC